MKFLYKRYLLHRKMNEGRLLSVKEAWLDFVFIGRIKILSKIGSYFRG